MNQFNCITFRLLLTFISIQSVVTVDVDAINDQTRIVNGSNATDGQFPHQVSLRKSLDNTHFCGGSIITSKWILTAAHCPKFSEGLEIIAVVGIIKLDQIGSIYRIDKVHIHPEYNIETGSRHDIALLQTSTEIVFNELVRPIALARRNTPANVAVTVSGWGSIMVSIAHIPYTNAILDRYSSINH